MICLITWCSTRRLLICQTSYENFCMSPQRYLQRSLNDHDELLIVRYGHDLWEKKKSFWEIPASMSSLSFQSSWSSLSSNYASKRAMTESVDFLVVMTYSMSFLLLRPLFSSDSFSFFLLKDHVTFLLLYLSQSLFFHVFYFLLFRFSVSESRFFLFFSVSLCITSRNKILGYVATPSVFHQHESSVSSLHVRQLREIPE